MGAALLFKQWALWPALPIVYAAPRGRRSLTAFYAFVVPALVLVPFLVAAPATWSSLVGTRASLAYGQPQLWLHVAFGQRHLANATLLRVAWGVVAVLVARRVRRNPTTDMLLAGVGATMLARLLFEPVLFGYYLVPATVVAVIWCARNGYPFIFRSITATLLNAYCLPQTFPQPVFFAILAFTLAYVCGPMISSVIARAGSGAANARFPAREPARPRRCRRLRRGGTRTAARARPGLPTVRSRGSRRRPRA